MVGFGNSSMLARMMVEIMFSEQYLNLLDSIYSTQDTIAEFEADPKQLLIRRGIHVPDAVDVVIHYSGAIGRPARVDFHLGRADKGRCDQRYCPEQRSALGRLVGWSHCRR
jgi:hypothetical protein